MSTPWYSCNANAHPVTLNQHGIGLFAALQRPLVEAQTTLQKLIKLGQCPLLLCSPIAATTVYIQKITMYYNTSMEMCIPNTL